MNDQMKISSEKNLIRTRAAGGQFQESHLSLKTACMHSTQAGITRRFTPRAIAFII